MIEEIMGTDLVGSDLEHKVNGYPCSSHGKVVSIKRSDLELTIHHTHRDTDIETTTRHPIDSLKIKRDEKTGEIRITSPNGTTVIKPLKR